MNNNKELDAELKETMTETIPNLCKFFYDNIELENDVITFGCNRANLCILSTTIKQMLTGLEAKMIIRMKDIKERNK